MEALQRFAIVEPIYTISDWLLPPPAIWKRWWRQGGGLVIFYLSNLANCRTRKNHDLFRSKPKSVWRQSIHPSVGHALECEHSQWCSMRGRGRCASRHIGLPAATALPDRSEILPCAARAARCRRPWRPGLTLVSKHAGSLWISPNQNTFSRCAWQRTKCIVLAPVGSTGTARLRRLSGKTVAS